MDTEQKRIRRRKDRPKREPEELLRDQARLISRYAGNWVTDPDQLVLLREGLGKALAEAEQTAVDNLRKNYSDAQIGEPFGITRWAVMRRWPRPGRGKRAAA